MLELRNVTKVYGAGDTRVCALQDVSFSVGRGEVLLVVGSSGSGKSTLLNMMGLLDRPTSGSVLIDGVPAAGLGDDAVSSLRNSRLGFVFQFSNLLADLTVLENVMLPASIAGAAPAARDYARQLVEAVGLEPQMHKHANRISGGQAQRAAIARALVNRPSLVLADEPTGNLDSVTADSVIGLIKSLARKMRQAFVIVTHDREQFGDVDRIITIKDGRHYAPVMETAS